MTLTTEKLNEIYENPEQCSYSEIQEMAAMLAKREAQPVAANAQIAGYFVRHRSVWDKEIMWKPWTECSGEDYAEYCKRIATGEADAGRFYEARILYDAPQASQSTNAADWGINMQTGTPILTYKNCCVIESEQAHYVLSLINSAATPAPAIPDIGSSVVNDAAWKLHDTLTKYGPLNGHQFNHLKSCLYEALKIVMTAPPAQAAPEKN